MGNFHPNANPNCHTAASRESCGRRHRACHVRRTDLDTLLAARSALSALADACLVSAYTDADVLVSTHADADVVVPTHADTDVLVSAHANTDVLVSAYTDVGVLVPTHADTDVLVPTHADTDVVVPAHTDTRLVSADAGAADPHSAATCRHPQREPADDPTVAGAIGGNQRRCGGTGDFLPLERNARDAIGL